MTRTARGIACLAIVAALAAAAMPVPAPKAEASHGDGPKFRAWLEDNSIFYVPPEPMCTLTGRIGMQEFGEHSVERFKWRATGYASREVLEDGQQVLTDMDWEWDLNYSGWYVNDSQSFRWTYVYNLTRPPPQTGEKGSRPTSFIAAEAVGIRPSFWRSDYVVSIKIGDCVWNSVEGGS